jgi:hypothetical protein
MKLRKLIVNLDQLIQAGHSHQIREHIDRVAGPDAPGNMARQALTGVLIDHHHQLDRAAIIGPVKHEIPRPHVVGSLRTEPDTGIRVEPQTASLWLSRRYFEALTTPDAHHPAMADLPAL